MNQMKMGGNQNRDSSTINHSHGIINFALLISNGQEIKNAIGFLTGDNPSSYSNSAYAIAAICLLSLSLLLQVRMTPIIMITNWILLITNLAQKR